MFKNCRRVRPAVSVILLFALSVTAVGQQAPQLAPAPASNPTQASTPTPESTPPPATAPATAPTPQMIKVMKNLSRYEEGTKLDIRLTDGSHQVGKVSETFATYFVFVDSVSGKNRNIDYLDVEGVHPTGKGALAHQLNKSTNGHTALVVGTVVVFAALGVFAILAARH
jgi:hypothetical protein